MSNQHLRRHRQSPVIRIELPASVPPPKKPRAVTGLDVFQGQFDNSSVNNSTVNGKHPVGHQRAEASQVWKSMSAEERGPYELEARARNEARALALVGTVSTEDEQKSDIASQTPLYVLFPIVICNA